MQAETLPPLDGASVDREQDVRAVMVELRARLDGVRRWYPAVLGEPTETKFWTLALHASNGFMILFPVALLWAAFSTGTAWLVIAGATAVCGLFLLVTVVPAKLRARKWRREADFTPLAIVDVDPLAFDPANELTRACYGVLSFDEAIEVRPRRLMAIADKVRAALAGAPSEDPQVQRFVAAVRPRIAELLVRGPGLEVPHAIAGDHSVRFVELVLRTDRLPGGMLDSRLVFVLAHRRDVAGDMLFHVQSDGMLGPGAVAISRAFPFESPRKRA